MGRISAGQGSPVIKPGVPTDSSTYRPLTCRSVPSHPPQCASPHDPLARSSAASHQGRTDDRGGHEPSSHPWNRGIRLHTAATAIVITTLTAHNR